MQIGAAPDERPPFLVAHLAGCDACRRFETETLRIEQRLRIAIRDVPELKATVPDAPPRTTVTPLPVPRSPAARRRSVAARWALAASVLLGLGLGAILWTSRIDTALAADVIAHMAHEPDSWRARKAVPESVLAFVLRKSGVQLDPGPTVSYAHSCYFRGQWVPHLVVQTSAGPVTVLILPGERLARREEFNDGDYAGVLEPAAGGAIALLARDNNMAAARAALADVTAVLRWKSRRG